MAKPYGARILSAVKSQAVAASTAVTLAPACSAVHAQQSGTLTATFVNDTTPQSIVVIQGIVYPYSLKSIEATNQVAVIALFNSDN